MLMNLYENLAKTLDLSPKPAKSDVDSEKQSRALEVIRKEKELIEFWKAKKHKDRKSNQFKRS